MALPQSRFAWPVNSSFLWDFSDKAPGYKSQANSTLSAYMNSQQKRHWGINGGSGIWRRLGWGKYASPYMAIALSVSSLSALDFVSLALWARFILSVANWRPLFSSAAQVSYWQFAFVSCASPHTALELIVLLLQTWDYNGPVAQCPCD